MDVDLLDLGFLAADGKFLFLTPLRKPTALSHYGERVLSQKNKFLTNSFGADIEKVPKKACSNVFCFFSFFPFFSGLESTW